jgi:hypothetical protein
MQSGHQIVRYACPVERVCGMDMALPSLIYRMVTTSDSNSMYKDAYGEEKVTSYPKTSPDRSFASTTVWLKVSVACHSGALAL